MIAISTRDKRTTICDADVQVIGLGFCTQLGALDCIDGCNGFDERGMHFLDAVVLLPSRWESSLAFFSGIGVWGVFVGGRAEVRHEESGEVLSVCAALDVLECFLGHGVAHCSLDLSKRGDVAIVHNGVDSECEGMVVGWCNGRCGCSSNVSEENGGGGICTEAAEVGVVERRLNVLVECRV